MPEPALSPCFMVYGSWRPLSVQQSATACIPSKLHTIWRPRAPSALLPLPATRRQRRGVPSRLPCRVPSVIAPAGSRRISARLSTGNGPSAIRAFSAKSRPRPGCDATLGRGTAKAGSLRVCSTASAGGVGAARVVRKLGLGSYPFFLYPSRIRVWPFLSPVFCYEPVPFGSLFCQL
jgi:hypothetical protein